MTRRLARAALLSAGLLVAACSSEGDGGTVPASDPAPATESVATYVRSGGPGGGRFQVVVRVDGTFVGGSTQPGQGQLGAPAFAELRRLVAAFAAAAPAPSYGTAPPDGSTTSVTAGGASTSVHSKASPPPAVQQLVGFLAALERQLQR